MDFINIIYGGDRQRAVLYGSEFRYRQPSTTILTWPAVKASTPQHGCHLAHRDIVKFAKQGSIPYIIIGEDDVKLTSPQALQYFFKTIPESFDIYTGGSYGAKVMYDPETHRIQRMSGTHFYAVHQRFYDRFLAMNEYEHIDQELTTACKEPGREMKMCYPMVALQRPGYSSIAQEEVNYNTEQFVQYPLYQSTLEKFVKECDYDNLKYRSMAQPY